VYAWAADLIKRLWKQGPMGQVLAVLALLAIPLGIGGLRVGLRNAVVRSATGCGLDEESAANRAKALITTLETHYGASKPGKQGTSRLAFDGFDVDYVSMYDPCYSFLAVRTTLATTSPAPPEQMMKALEDRDIGGRYEKGLRGSFAYDADETTFRIVYIVEIKKEHPSTIVHTVEEMLSIRDAWRGGWFEEVALVVRGEGKPPPKHVYRPGKDPESVLRGIDAFLKDAGQEGIYP
jgi:hypothetical protein